MYIHVVTIIIMITQNCNITHSNQHSLMHHASPASMGVVSCDMSLPYKHSPASKRSTSLAPKPAILTAPSCTDSSFSVNVTTSGVGTETWQ